MNASLKLSIATGTGIALALAAGISGASAAEKEKCFGITLKGENQCANLSKTHSCQGQSTVDYDKGEWVKVAKGTCSSTVITADNGVQHRGLLKDQAKAALAG